MVSLLTMLDGVSLAGRWVHRRVKTQGDEQRWWQAPWQTAQTAMHQVQRRIMARTPATPLRPATEPLAPAVPQGLDAQAATITHGLRTSVLALGVTTVGGLIAPPLQIAGLPLLVYMGVPAAKAAYEQLWLNDRPPQALAETIVLVVGLARGCYWISALGFCCYYGVRHWRLKPRLDDVTEPATPIMAHCRQDGTTLRPGNHVSFQSGEVVPVDGLIVEGVAWMRDRGASVPAAGLRKAAGDRVMAADLVLVGRICVRTFPVA